MIISQQVIIKLKKISFAHSKYNEIWINLLEKAWAKINGCYAQISGKFTPYEIFDILTEAYTEVTYINKNSRSSVKTVYGKR